MSIYRGSGGSGDANTDATINEVTELVQDANQYKDEAATSASNAATSASNAATSESNASTSETNASSSASDAATSETNAATSETNAASSATSASTSASSASTSATAAQTAQTSAETAQASAETAETNASASATSASSSASTATTQAGIATTKASEASTSATNAATSETNAGNSASAASTSATNAANSASTALTAASNASTSESNASTSETNAAASATSASSSASSATSSASSAAGSATTATTKASEASTSASNAATSETNASNSASSASTSATNASTSESNAATSATNAEAAYDNFDDRYLGAKASDPTLDNDGDALITGALYFNTTADVMKVWEGSSWVAAYASLSGALIASDNLSDLDSASSALTNLGIANHDDITVDGSGNVGIGTGTPSYKLEVRASAGGAGAVFTGANAGGNAQINVNSGYSSTVPVYGFFFNGGTGIGNPTANATSFIQNSSEAMRIDSAGNVGIGTSSPASKLDVKSGTNADSTGQPSGNFAATIYHATNNSTSNGLLVKNNWAATASTVFEVGLDLVGGAYRQFYKIDGTGQTIWSPVGVERMRIDSSGKVGIGTSSPSTELEVDGTVTATSFSGDGSSLTGLPAGYTDSDALSLFNASGSAPVYACRAWVNFNGTGTVAIRASGNVSSITDNAVGQYTINFTTAMPDVNYAVVGVGHQLAADHVVANVQSTADQLVGSVKVHTTNYNGANVDPDILSLTITR